MSKKVLVVEDSPITRKYLANLLEAAGFIVDTAQNGKECLDKLKKFNPDVITLDIYMPIMDGLSCLKKIMANDPRPVIMVSCLTDKGAKATIESLELGAIDYVYKSTNAFKPGLGEHDQILIEKIHAAAKVKIVAKQKYTNIVELRKKQSVETIKQTVESVPLNTKTNFDLIVIGVSTGGPACLQSILQNLPATFPTPIVIAQHMPAKFTNIFAKRLDSLCKLSVIEVVEQQKIKPGYIYIAKGENDIELTKKCGQIHVGPTPLDDNYMWHPSVSKLVECAMKIVNPKRLLCVQLTGMGTDGAKEMQIANSHGSTTIAESEETSVVFGMPKALINMGGASMELPNYRIAEALVKRNVGV